MFLPSEPTLIKEFLESYFYQWAETCSVQSELHSYILICTYTNQLEHVKQTSQDSAIWIPHLLKNKQIENLGGNFL